MCDELIEKMKTYFGKIESFFPEGHLELFMQTHYENLDYYQYKLGTMIRLKILVPTSPIYKLFANYGIHNTDTMALVLIQNYYIHKKSQEINGIL